MRRAIPALALVLLLGTPAASVMAAEKTAGSPGVTLTGEVLDLACYLAHGGKGPEHAACAAKCAEMGQPIDLSVSPPVFNQDAFSFHITKLSQSLPKGLGPRRAGGRRRGSQVSYAADFRRLLRHQKTSRREHSKQQAGKNDSFDHAFWLHVFHSQLSGNGFPH